MQIELTQAEADALKELSEETGLPQERVLIQALRLYQAVHKCKAEIVWPNELPMMKEEPHVA